MAVSQNIARLRALLNGFSVSNATITTLNATTLSGSRLCLTDAESVTAGCDDGSNVVTQDLSVTTGVSIVTTAANSGSVTLPSGQASGQLKYVVLGTKASQNLTLSASVGLTASLDAAKSALSLVWDGSSWNMVSSSGEPGKF